MLDDDRFGELRGFPMHSYFSGIPRYGQIRPSLDIAQFGKGLAGREPGIGGHDSINHWRAADKVIAAAGLDPDTWGRCLECGGHGSDERYPGQRADSRAWTRVEPPAGEGWQVWETVSEGSPITPVLESREELIAWLAEHYVPVGRDSTLSVAEAAAFVDSGYAPSFVASPKRGFQTGVEAALGQAEDDAVREAEALAAQAAASPASAVTDED
jgi:hypothetical protein